jgi:hypothetical protein
MKHIKLYEAFNQSDYYINITEPEYDKLMYGTQLGYQEGEIDSTNKDVFTSREVDFINNLTSYKDYLWVSFWERADDVSTDSFDESVRVALTYRGDNIYITKIEDGYFIVNFMNNINELYKCDQFEGLVRFLKDKKVIT